MRWPFERRRSSRQFASCSRDLLPYRSQTRARYVQLERRYALGRWLTMALLHDKQAPDFAPEGLGDLNRGGRVHRFTSTERILHWWVVATFALALFTGLAMGDEAESGPLLQAHIAAVVLIGAGVVVALVFGNTMALLRSVKNLFIIDRTDVRCLTMTLRHQGHKDGRIPWGKFNLGQKFLAWSLLGSVSALIVTGVNSWKAGGDAAGPHSVAVVASLILLGSHVFMAVVNPSTRPAFPGMVFGHVRRSWAAKHHSGWLKDVDAKKR